MGGSIARPSQSSSSNPPIDQTPRSGSRMAEPAANRAEGADRGRTPRWTSGRIAVGLGLVASLAVVLTLADPGITIDEPLDVRPGRTYVATLRARGLRFFDRGDGRRASSATTPSTRRWAAGCWGSPRRWASRSRCSCEGPRPGRPLRRLGPDGPGPDVRGAGGPGLGDGRETLRPSRRSGRRAWPWRSCPGSSPMRTSGRSTRSSPSSGPSPCSRRSRRSEVDSARPR